MLNPGVQKPLIPGFTRKNSLRLGSFSPPLLPRVPAGFCGSQLPGAVCSAPCQGRLHGRAKRGPPAPLENKQRGESLTNVDCEEPPFRRIPLLLRMGGRYLYPLLVCNEGMRHPSGVRGNSRM